MKTLSTAAVLSALVLGAALPAAAQQAGDWTLGVGIGSVMPKSGNGALAPGELDVDDNIRPTLTFEYFFRDNWGVEVLAAWPFKHKLNIAGLGEIGSTQHLPPTISIQYHFATGTAFTPFVGVGVNYTNFFNEKATGPIAGADLKIDDSWGLAAHIGADYRISDRGAIRVDARWIDIDADVMLNGANIGKANIDPWVVGVSYIHRF